MNRLLEMAVLCLVFLAPGVAWTQCFPIYGGTSLSVGGSSSINGNLITGSGKAVNATTGVRSNTTMTLGALSPASFPANSSSTDTSASTVAAGNYDDVTVTSSTTFTGGTYNIRKLRINDSTATTFAPGSYFIDEVDGGSSLGISVSPAGPVKIYVKTRFRLGDNFGINTGGSAANFQILLYDGARVEFGNSFGMNGVIYAPGSSTRVTIGGSFGITGAIVSGGEVQLGTSFGVTYDASAATTLTTLSGCVAATLASFNINIGSSTASTCTPKQITITARDSGGATLTGYTGTVNLTTSTARGDWAKVTANGTLNNGTANDGAATYAFVAGDAGVITLSLTNRSAQTLTVTVNDTAAGVSATSASMTFSNNTFVIATDPVQVAGRNQAMTATVFASDGTNCAIDTAYAGSKALKGWLTRDAQDPGGTAPAIGAVSLPNAQPGANNLTMTFTAGVASFSLASTDVGKYVLNLRDDTTTGLPAAITGASASITTRPFVLGFSAIQSGATVNPGGTATGGNRFVTAGTAFQATVAGYRWSAAADANNDGVPDDALSASNTAGGVTASYRWLTALSAVSTADFSPAGGTLGTLGGTTSIAQGSFSGGAFTPTDLTYSEAGAVRLRADATGYLGTPGVNPSGFSALIGRFYPHQFAMVSNTLTAGCSGQFTYMGAANLGVVFTIEAQNAASVRTQNYDATRYFPGNASGRVRVAMIAENNNNGTDLSARITGVPTPGFVAGQYVVNTSAADFTRNPATPEGPYDQLRVGVRLIDDASNPDYPTNTFQALTLRDMDPATSGTCNAATTCTGRQFTGATRARFGRVRFINASGSQLLPLSMLVEAQYFLNGGFSRNTLDACTTLTAANFTLSNFQPKTTSGSVSSFGAGSTAITSVGAMTQGRLAVSFSAPGAGREGSVDVGLNLGATTAGNFCSGTFPSNTGANRAYLRGRWCGAAYDRDPVGRATFGIYRSTDALILHRENY
jgi:hypothetical protein